jgi:hypothetical protein
MAARAEVATGVDGHRLWNVIVKGNQARAESGLVRLSLWAVTAVVFVALVLMLWPEITAGFPLSAAERHKQLDLHFGIAILAGCMMPSMLARIGFSLIEKRSVPGLVGFRFPPSVASEEADRARASWNYELGRANLSLARAGAFAGLWGVVTLLALVAGVILLLPPFHDLGGAFAHPHNLVGFALIGVAGTRFLLDLARIGRRIANDDASKRMFAQALENQILTVITALLVMLLARVFGLDKALDVVGSEGSQATGAAAARVAVALGIGTAVATVGAPAFDWVTGKAARAFGVAMPDDARGMPLSAVAGLCAADTERLKEEGVGSVESLASTPLPRLFMNTRFPLSRLCDWMDRSLLLVHVGRDAAARLGLPGVLALRAASAAQAPALLARLGKALQIDEPAQVQMILDTILADERLAILDVYRQTLIIPSDLPEGVRA